MSIYRNRMRIWSTHWKTYVYLFFSPTFVTHNQDTTCTVALNMSVLRRTQLIFIHSRSRNSRSPWRKSSEMSWMPILNFPISTRYFCHTFFRSDPKVGCQIFVFMIYQSIRPNIICVITGRFKKTFIVLFENNRCVLMLWQGAAEDSEAKSEELNRVVEELHKLLKDAGEGTRLFTCLLERMFVVWLLMCLFNFFQP